jgi:hypothetical protein
MSNRQAGYGHMTEHELAAGFVRVKAFLDKYASHETAPADTGSEGRVPAVPFGGTAARDVPTRPETAS